MCAKLIQGINDLQTQFPKVALFFDVNKNGIRASDVHAHSNKKFWWFCNNGHSFQMTVLNRIKREESCPYCSGNRVLVGFNDLATVYPQIASEWDYEKNGNYTPYDFTYGSGFKAWWKCNTCGNSYQSNINLHIRGHKCPYCAGTIVTKGKNDLATLFPEIAAEYSKENKTPADEVSAHSHKKVIWNCPACGNTYESSINHRVHGTGCPHCHQSGGEQIIRKILDKYNIKYKAQGWFPDCRDIKPLRYDFLIYDDQGQWKGAIEYNGLQHYKAIPYFSNSNESAEEALEIRKKHELIKTVYAIEHGASPLKIPYRTHIPIEDIVVNFLTNLELIK